jgi:hypothetical protein
VAVEGGSAAADRAYWETAATAGGAYASPALFAATLPSAAAAEVAAAFGLVGPCVVVTGRGTSPRVPSDATAAALGAAHVLAIAIDADRADAILGRVAAAGAP